MLTGLGIPELQAAASGLNAATPGEGSFPGRRVTSSGLPPVRDLASEFGPTEGLN